MKDNLRAMNQCKDQATNLTGANRLAPAFSEKRRVMITASCQSHQHDDGMQSSTTCGLRDGQMAMGPGAHRRGEGVRAAMEAEPRDYANGFREVSAESGNRPSTGSMDPPLDPRCHCPERQSHTPV